MIWHQSMGATIFELIEKNHIVIVPSSYTISFSDFALDVLSKLISTDDIDVIYYWATSYIKLGVK